ncbi:MAG: 50S ribosomal protein L1 [Candidatus Microsaccharimonas sossegonensis]|uniref:Large ribosomal subunit protein uL1 n=1 Tax=Candidatus Microsaccharimonas sossegonensis TaxID=2506948 RepID=A0A4Q0AHQ4_9BACT|nr:MAG: 50S ribosomal protein L1 [Candidatus Microsaccharimonas sossegonensis]
MAKKANLLEEAKTLGLDVSEKNTIAQIEAAIADAQDKPVTSEPAVAPTEVVASESVAETSDEPKLAKAGKRSAKALAEAKAKGEKDARKAAGNTASADGEPASVKKGPKPITRPLLERRGKKYQAVAKLIEKGKAYALTEAVELATKTSPSKFDASIEVHVRLGVDPRQADQNIRATVSLPHGTGKTIRVAVFAPEADHASATKAGADIVGDETFLAQLDKETIDFDILIATPQYMPRLGKYARLLGPRGLMPNPKSGSVATDVAKAVSEAKTGKVEHRVDKQAIVHLSIGKVSFGAEKLHQNAKSFFDSLMSQKPTSLKGSFVTSISLSTTQGPSIKVENFIN